VPYSGSVSFNLSKINKIIGIAAAERLAKNYKLQAAFLPRVCFIGKTRTKNETRDDKNNVRSAAGGRAVRLREV
jgi:hypothetical protein